MVSFAIALPTQVLLATRYHGVLQEIIASRNERPSGCISHARMHELCVATLVERYSTFNAHVQKKRTPSTDSSCDNRPPTSCDLPPVRLVLLATSQTATIPRPHTGPCPSSRNESTYASSLIVPLWRGGEDGEAEFVAEQLVEGALAGEPCTAAENGRDAFPAAVHQGQARRFDPFGDRGSGPADW